MTQNHEAGNMRNREAGAALTEYALAMALLVVGLVVINASLFQSVKDKGIEIAEGSTQMVPCTSSDENDKLRNAINSNYRSSICQ
jgi:Flp pilus assembly pilin Flp